jgi:hypothetical protein
VLVTDRLRAAFLFEQDEVARRKYVGAFFMLLALIVVALVGVAIVCLCAMLVHYLRGRKDQ